jgi:tetrahydromethanopterin S-methyltransferase subunit G
VDSPAQNDAAPVTVVDVVEVDVVDVELVDELDVELVGIVQLFDCRIGSRLGRAIGLAM